MNILNWPNWTVIRVEETDSDYRISAQPTTPPNVCIFCGTIGQLRPYGARAQRFMDLPVHAKRTGILVERRRLNCQSCGRIFIEPLPEMDEKRRMTKRLLQFIQSESLRRTFTDVADRCGLDEKTVRLIFKEYTAELAKTYEFVTPAVLGIDELHLIGKPRCVLTNVEYRTIIDLLEKRDQQTVQAYLSKLKDGHKIEVVTMDMWRPYRLAVEATLPNAVVVVDKFHIVRMANVALEQVRKDLRESLSDKKRRTLKKDRQAYELKESFFDIWDAADKQTAWAKYEDWKASIPTDLAGQFKDITTAVENWKGPIFNYFDTRVTNAYTEALNGVMKVVNRNGRGYSFEAIRAKMLYAEAHMYRKRPYGKAWQKPAEPTIDQTWLVAQSTPITPEQYQAFVDFLDQHDNLGVPLATYNLETGEITVDDESTTESE